MRLDKSKKGPMEELLRNWSGGQEKEVSSLSRQKRALMSRTVISLE
jgi:hypothetical protein